MKFFFFFNQELFYNYVVNNIFLLKKSFVYRNTEGIGFVIS